MTTYSLYDPNGVGVAYGLTLEAAREWQRFYEDRQYAAGDDNPRPYTIREDADV